MSNHSNEQPVGLLSAWTDMRNALKITVAHTLLLVLLIFVIRLLKQSSVFRDMPDMPISVALGCLTIHMLIHAYVRYRSTDVRLPIAIFVLCASCFLTLAIGIGLMSALPNWSYVDTDNASRKIHVLNGFVIAGIFSVFLALFYAVATDLRLSALDATRDLRLNPTRYDERNAEAKTGFWKALKSLLTLDQPTNEHSLVLAPWTWQRVIVYCIGQWFVCSLAVDFTSGLTNGLSEVGTGPSIFQSLRFTVSDAFHLFAVPLLVFAPHVALTLANRTRWMNHAISSSILALVLASIASLIGSIFWLRQIPEGLESATVLFIHLVWLTVLSSNLNRLNNRAEQIKRAQLIEADKQAAVAEVQRAAAQTELRSLQAQIEPHFLYNTLTNLQLLIRQDSRSDAHRADDMVGHLIHYLRSRLPIMREATTTLEKELEMIRSYLAIIQIRMGERLSYTINAQDDCLQATLPPLALMTLVENCIRHGLEPKRGGGSILIQTNRVDDQLQLSVADTGVGFVTGSGGTGVGLANLKERLRLSYGDAARVDLAMNEPIGMVATIHLPLVTQN